MPAALSEVLALVKELAGGKASDARILEIVERMDLDAAQLKMIRQAARDRPALQAALDRKIG